MFGAGVLYCALAIESFWWRVRFGKPDILVSYVHSETGMKWLTKAQEEGLLTSEDRSAVDAIFTVRHAHMHFNPHMKTVARYNNALKKFGLDSAEFAKEGEHIASEPIAKNRAYSNGRTIAAVACITGLNSPQFLEGKLI